MSKPLKVKGLVTFVTKKSIFPLERRLDIDFRKALVEKPPNPSSFPRTLIRGAELNWCHMRAHLHRSGGRSHAMLMLTCERTHETYRACSCYAGAR